ncbi:hypothetical protein GCM10009127_15630 [Alteraurantiacibacter aestuarii]|uniref:Uncharacterized protein n=1 Tax=Alteraurantiacibacter aestuarii TaxID=650004 RepID=A0A844ZH85_9SPHN|nr:hypothetical protein [Alteraurantiacibacter aestuarii]MXO87851.1 hypothetical protein [Alteraurantiacibacter aestuarii]
MLTRSPFSAALAGLACMALSACIPASSEQAPAPSPAPAPVSAPPPPPPTISVVPILPLPDDWAEQPRTAGDWTYVRNEGGSGARFIDDSGATLLVIGCYTDTRRVLIGRPAQGLPEAPRMDIRTETAQRAANLTRGQDGASVTWAFEGSDRFLDAIAFSRGHFAVGVTGAAPIYPPAYPEITRVIEDCR